MNPSPERSKECLPPKKRDSRQGSSDQPAPEDDFKPPAPFRSRRQHYSTEGHRESGDLLPPPLPTLPPLPLSLPWQVSYAPSMHHSYLPVQVGERRGAASAPWRETLCGRGMDGGLENAVPHHSRWLSSDIPPISVQPLISVPMFKSVYAAESREMWSYGPGRQDYSSSLFPPHLFAQPPVYPHDALPDSRLRYQGRRPNGVEGTNSGSGPSRRMPPCDDCENDSATRLDGPHANGRRRQESTRGQTTGKGLLPRESTGAHSSPWDRDPRGTPKTPTPPSSDTKTGKAVTSQDHFGGSASQAGAQIYYAVGSLCQSAHHNSQKYPQLSPSVSCSPRKSQHFLQSQHNSHGVEWDPSAGSYRPPVAVLTGPDPPPSAVLPHFAKGSLIELAGGHLKRVEELKTEDFLRSADTLPEFHLSTCTILLISPGPTYGFNHLQVLLTDRNTQELLTVLAEYPFFVRDRGWSSCSPQRSAQLYGLQCRQLSTGDVCLALTPTPASPHSAAPPAQRPHVRPGDAAERTFPVPAPAPAPAPPSPAAVQPPPSSPLSERPRARKRRWSAPELEPGIETSTHLPQGSKHERQQ
ncbi:ataxin-1-like protein [Labeo rohita]|uniref:Ataxin-1-like protein n=1 Tax=Labeo rohita TaxID=84645 RepID=A0A498MRN8_LABRO|nr:ataxin-1-like protein [Labeo rohita]